MSVNESKKVYVPPQANRIPRIRETAKLYEREEALYESFTAAAQELGKVLRHHKEDYWTRTVPQAIYDFMDHFDCAAVRAACKAWLELNPEVAP